MLARKKSVRLYRDLPGREEPEAREVRVPIPRAGPRLAGLVEEPLPQPSPEAKVGRPPITGTAMSATERKRRQRALAPRKCTIAEIKAILDKLIEDKIDNSTVLGIDKLIREEKSLDRILAILKLIRQQSNDRKGFHDDDPGRKVGRHKLVYTVGETLAWLKEQREWECDEQTLSELESELIFTEILVETTVCLLCDWFKVEPTDLEIYQHLQTHRGQRHLMDAFAELACINELGLDGIVIVDEPRCILCGREGTEHMTDRSHRRLIRQTRARLIQEGVLQGIS